MQGRLRNRDMVARPVDGMLSMDARVLVAAASELRLGLPELTAPVLELPVRRGDGRTPPCIVVGVVGEERVDRLGTRPNLAHLEVAAP